MPADGGSPSAAVSLAYEGGTSEQTDAALGVLRSLGIRASFYLSSTDLLRDPKLWRGLAAEGHEIGMHPLRGVSDEHGNLPNWTLAMVEGEFDEANRLFEELLPGAPRSLMLLGDEMTCSWTESDRTPAPYLAYASTYFDAIVRSETGSNPPGTSAFYRSAVFESAESAILQTAIAQREGEWLILRIGSLRGLEDDHDELCKWLVMQGESLEVAPVVELARRNSHQTVG